MVTGGAEAAVNGARSNVHIHTGEGTSHVAIVQMAGLLGRAAETGMDYTSMGTHKRRWEVGQVASKGTEGHMVHKLVGIVIGHDLALAHRS